MEKEIMGADIGKVGETSLSIGSKGSPVQGRCLEIRNKGA